MRLIKLGASCMALVALVAFATALRADELGSNNGFEDPIGPVGGAAPNVWNPFVGPGAAGAGTDTVAPLAGATHASIVIAGANDSFAGFQHQVNGITTGETYSFGLNARSVGPVLGGINAEFRLEWLDAAGGFVGGQFDNNVDISTGLTNSYAFFTQSHVAPAGATSLRAVFAVQSFGAGDNNGGMFVDNTTIQGPSAIPEPASAALLCLGMIGLVARRQRN